MAKVVVTLNGQIHQDVALLKSRLTVGRRPGHDLVLDHLTVSGQHAAIDTAPNGTFILDLGSTNGTLVNGQPITKHLLQNDDVIDIGKYKITFLADSIAVVANSVAHVVSAETKMANVAIEAKIRVLNGSNNGREITLSKPITTLGTPGTLMITIRRDGQNFLLQLSEGESLVKINDQLIREKSQYLQHEDVIDLAGIKMLFYCKSNFK
ncbi:MAG: FHA domain-containing protein [Undibacterium sp.]|nr:FHA domain-containing protein [Undibacterium sp.]